MCGPAALPILAIAASAVTAGGQLYAGSAAKQQGKYEQKVANINADRQRAAAADAAIRGETDQLRRYRQLAQSLGAQRAASAANGVDIGFGSALDMQIDTAMIGQEDSRILAENTRREMMGFDINAANYTMQGQAARSRGNAAMTSSIFAAGGTLLGGAQQAGKIKAGT